MFSEGFFGLYIVRRSAVGWKGEGPGLLLIHACLAALSAFLFSKMYLDALFPNFFLFSWACFLFVSLWL